LESPGFTPVLTKAHADFPSVCYSDHIFATHVRTIYGQTTAGISSHPLGGIFFLWAFWKAESHPILLGWYAALILVCTARAAAYVAFRKRAALEAMRRWEVLYIWLAFLQAAVWSAAWWIFNPMGDPTRLAIVTMLVIGLSGIGSIGYVSHMRALLAFFVPVVVPAFALLFAQGGTYGRAFGLILIVYTIALARAMLPMNKAMVQAIRQNFGLVQFAMRYRVTTGVAKYASHVTV